MKFEELDNRLRIYETANDFCVLPGMFMVARIDGRSFTKLTKEIHRFEAPFDEKFRDFMVETTKHLMNCGFRIIYGYTQSDEISLVFHSEDETFNRKLRKLNSVLAGEASAKFSLLLGAVASFDCRICQLPTRQLLLDYLRWRNEDAHRNALNAHCYWALRRKGLGVAEATQSLLGLSVSQKNELLFQEAAINFNDVPNWQKRGIGVYWRSFEKQGINQLTGNVAYGIRRKLHADYDLPMREDYSSFIESLIEQES
jgi:tRNA(His) guanylyltransferase